MIKIAIPNKGRLSEKTISILEEAGFEFDINHRKLFSIVENYEMEILFTRTDDIPIYLERGIVDIGITGEDIVMEHESNLINLLELKFGKCRIVVAAPNGKYKSVSDITSQSIKVATSFPNITKSYFKTKNITADIADIHGAVEISPRLGLADVIVDITSSGTTLEKNDLEILDVIAHSQASLFVSEKSYGKYKEKIDTVTAAIKSVLDAHEKKYLMANIPVSEIENIKGILPSITAPTILPLSGKNDIVAIHTVMENSLINKSISALKKHRATGILVMNIERIYE